MSRLKKQLASMARKQTARSPRKPSESGSEILLQEQASVGKLDEKDESMPNLLIESTPVQLTLVESEESKKSGKTIARGEFGRCDVATQNGRIYPLELIEREIGKLSEDLKSRRVLGELDHPLEGKTSLKRVSHLITDLKIKDGIVIGECEILGTPEGKTLKALIDAGVQVGVSSRGFGSTRPATSGKGEVVQEDFVLKTYDFVADPAVKTAVPGIFTEDVDDASVAQMFLSEFPEIAAALSEGKQVSCQLSEDAAPKTDKDREAIRAEMSENFERKLAETLVETKEALSTEIRESYDSDPEIGGAKAILAQIAEMVGVFHQIPEEKVVRDALKAKDLEVSESKSALEDMSGEVRKLKLELRMEKRIGVHPMAESIRKLMKVENYDTEDDMMEALESVISNYPSIEDSGFVSVEEVKLREENAEAKGQLSLLESKVNELKAKLQKAVKLGERIDNERQEALRNAKEAQEKLEERLGDYKDEVSRTLEESKDALSEATRRVKDLELEVYKRDKVATMPNGRNVLSLLESARSEEAVDQLVARNSNITISDGELDEMRRGVMSKGSANARLEEAAPTKRQVGSSHGLEGLGVPDMAAIQRLAGLNQ